MSQNRFNVGDRVRDANPGWARYNQTGTVVSVINDRISWRSDYDNALIQDPIGDMRRMKLRNRNRRNISRKMSNINHQRGRSQKRSSSSRTQRNSRGDYKNPTGKISNSRGGKNF